MCREFVPLLMKVQVPDSRASYLIQALRSQTFIATARVPFCSATEQPLNKDNNLYSELLFSLRLSL